MAIMPGHHTPSHTHSCLVFILSCQLANLEQSSEEESHWPDPLWSLVIVSPMCQCAVSGLVAVVIVTPVGPVSGVQCGQAKRTQQGALQGLKSSPGMLRGGEVRSNCKGDGIVRPQLVVGVFLLFKLSLKIMVLFTNSGFLSISAPLLDSIQKYLSKLSLILSAQVVSEPIPCTS